MVPSRILVGGVPSVTLVLISLVSHAFVVTMSSVFPK